ncbi:MAG: hypothetical protein H0X44_05115 [Acidobacteria bacterium]|nr:hypothetical protein [Acidobacteriota bacterium]
MLDGWAAFARRPARGAIRVIEGSFLQLPVGVMLAMNQPAARIRALVRNIDAIVAGADGALVYLHTPDVRKALLGTGDIRGMRWLEEMTGALARSPYGRAHRARGLDALIRFYARQRDLIDALLPRLSTRHAAFDVTRADWDRTDRRVSEFLGIRRSVAPRLTRDELLRHAGTYRGARRRQPAAITTDGVRLYLQLPATSVLPLVRVSDGRFCPMGLPIDIAFTYGRGGRASRFTYASRMAGDVLDERSWVRG